VNEERLFLAIDCLRQNDRDPDAWENLYRAVYPYLLTVMFRAVRGNQFLAEEGVQEVMLRVLRNYDFSTPLANPASLMLYLKNTARSVVIDLVRRQNREGRVHTFDCELSDANEQPDPRVDPAQRALLENALELAKRTLRPRELEVLELILEGRKIGEVAAALGVSEKTAYNAVSLVRKRMRGALFAN
jgi:RNA polymerase sigma factor (sigma-70 family)